DALPLACPVSLLAVGRPLAIYRSLALTAFPGVSAHPDGPAPGAQVRARLPHPRNVWARLVLSPRQAAALDRAGRQARQGKMSSASSTRMTNGSKREGGGARTHYSVSVRGYGILSCRAEWGISKCQGIGESDH